MTSICVVGKGSFVGGAVARGLKAQRPGEFEVSEVDTLDDSWREVDFSAYDSLLYVAGVVPWNLDRRALKLRSDGEAQAYLNMVNADLAYAIASKAKSDGARHLVFMSTSDVYAKGPSSDPAYVVDSRTAPCPESMYGISKRRAEKMIGELADGSFGVAILRPPLIYGPGCTRGSFASLVKLASKLPVFPDVDNARSMLFTGNLAELVAILAKEGMSGTYLPQDPEWVRTSDLVCLIRESLGHRTLLSRPMGAPCGALAKRSKLFRKLFGNFRYAFEEGRAPEGYQRYELSTAVAMSLDAGLDCGGVGKNGQPE